jgi:hypothetical protein
LDDDAKINEIENFRRAALNELPEEIAVLLQISDSTKDEDCIEHSDFRSILSRK